MTDDEFLTLDAKAASRHVAMLDKKVERRRLVDLYVDRHSYSRAQFVKMINTTNLTGAGGNSSSSSALGILLMLAGIACMLGSFAFNVSVDTPVSTSALGLSLPTSVANVDLISIRSMISQIGGFLFVGGCIFSAASSLRRSLAPS